MVNSFIHVLMYSYYGLSALGPSVAKYLWWKKYLTILQLIQFTTALILGINGIRSGCDFPLWMQYALVIYMISFIVLFGNFYIKAYIAKVIFFKSISILTLILTFSKYYLDIEFFFNVFINFNNINFLG